MGAAIKFPFNVYLLALFGSALCTAISLPLWRAWCKGAGAMDDPGHRKIHATPTPLAGGLAVMTGLIAPVLAASIAILFFVHAPSVTFHSLHYGLSHRVPQLLGILVGALGMLLIGLWDDRFELSPALKFGGQLFFALIVAMTGVRITLFVHSIWFSYFITVLWILTVINAFNFMDNMNGLCAGLGAIGVFWLALMAATAGQYLVATIALLTTGAIVGFLPFNFPKASVFLGDAGSHLVGFLMAVLAILPHFYTAKNPHPWAVLKPLIVLAVPLGDLVWVVILRWRLGKPFYVGDNNHLSHRLVRRGLNKTSAVLIIWALAAGFGATAVLWP